MKKGFVVIAIVLAVLHQDTWLWNDASLLFGFLPYGLAYHALYSLVVGGFWAWVVYSAWPDDLSNTREPSSAPMANEDRGGQP